MRVPEIEKQIRMAQERNDPALDPLGPDHFKRRRELAQRVDDAIYWGRLPPTERTRRKPLNPLGEE